MPNSAVTGSLCIMASSTGCWSWMDCPRLPCRACQSHKANCVGRGLSRPNCWCNAAIACGVANSPRSTRAGSPGIRCIVMNVTKHTSSATGSMKKSRRAIYRATSILLLANAYGGDKSINLVSPRLSILSVLGPIRLRAGEHVCEFQYSCWQQREVLNVLRRCLDVHPVVNKHKRSVRVARSGENGFLSSKRTWEESTVTTDCTFDISLKRGDDGVDNIRLMLNTTASALKGVPSWNFTSLRSVNTNCVGEVYDHAVARSGTMALCSSSLTSVS